MKFHGTPEKEEVDKSDGAAEGVKKREQTGGKIVRQSQ